MPSVSKTTKKIKLINRIGDISSEEWRQFENQKEETEINDILIKKLLDQKLKKRKKKYKKRNSEKKSREGIILQTYLKKARKI